MTKNNDTKETLPEYLVGENNFLSGRPGKGKTIPYKASTALMEKGIQAHVNINDILIGMIGDKLNLLVQSIPGSGKTKMIEKALTQQGIKAAFMEGNTISNQTISGIDVLGEEGKKITNIHSIKEYIKSSLEGKDYLVIDTSPETDLSAYSEVAKELQIPVIVIINTDTEFKISGFDNVERLVEATNRIVPFSSKKCIIDNIKNLKKADQPLEKNNSLKLN